jgi:hypothetical protein
MIDWDSVVEWVALVSISASLVALAYGLAFL